MTCPAISCIREIRGSANYLDESPMIVVGGHEEACDEISYFINVIKLEFARFKLGEAPSSAVCKRKYQQLFSVFTPTTTCNDTYMYLINTISSVRLQDQLTNTIAELRTLEQHMCMCADYLSSVKREFHITIPGTAVLELPPSLVAAGRGFKHVYVVIIRLHKYISELTMTGSCTIATSLASLTINPTTTDTFDDPSLLLTPLEHILTREHIQQTVDALMRVCDIAIVHERYLCECARALHLMHEQVCSMTLQILKCIDQ